MYCFIGNLEQKHRSIFLITIFHNTTMTRFGLINVLLSPLVDDKKKKLEKGVLMSLKGEPTVVRGTLAAIIADNLASHQIGGFKIGFSNGFRKCQFCMATDIEIMIIIRSIILR